MTPWVYIREESTNYELAGNRYRISERCLRHKSTQLRAEIEVRLDNPSQFLLHIFGLIAAGRCIYVE